MRNGIPILSVALTFLLLACNDKDKGKEKEFCEAGDKHCKEKLCEAGDERCEVGDGKCVVGYDGDCDFDQVCYAGKGAPKGKQGTCVPGEFDEKGNLRATVGFRRFIQGERTVLPNVSSRDVQRNHDCFFGCSVPSIAPHPYPTLTWLGKAAATLEVSVRGPHAETEQLTVTVRGVEADSCAKLAPASLDKSDRVWWQCHFPTEGWAGLNTLELLKLGLWTESTRDMPWTDSFLVDTLPLELHLKAQLQHLPHLNGGGKYALGVSAHKTGVEGRGWEGPWPWVGVRAWLSKLHYVELKVFRNNAEISTDFEPQTHVWPLWDWHAMKPQAFDYLLHLPADFKPDTDTLEIHATVSATDLADNAFPNSEFPGGTLKVKLEP